MITIRGYLVLYYYFLRFQRISFRYIWSHWRGYWLREIIKFFTVSALRDTKNAREKFYMSKYNKYLLPHNFYRDTF